MKQEQSFAIQAFLNDELVWSGRVDGVDRESVYDSVKDQLPRHDEWAVHDLELLRKIRSELYD